MENVSLLAMVGHGTTGTDGIENGNHLRWAFDRRLGFPMGGFRIYRRMTDGPQILPQKGCVDFIENTTYNAPFGLIDPGFSVYIGLEWRLDCSATNYPVAVQNEPAIHPSQLFLKFRRTLRIKFPQMAMYASVRAYYSAGNGIRMQAFNSQSATPNDPVAETTYTGSANSLTELELRGEGSLLSPRVEFDVIEITMRGGLERICYGGATKTVVQGATWQLISQDPIALPYTHNNYPLQHPRSGQPDGDWLEAKFRSRVRRYDREDFEEMEAVFKALFDDDPAQSMMIHKEVYPAENGNAGTESELEIFPADLLVLTAIDPAIARIVGLYFVDKKALAGVAYDYMVEGIWTKATSGCLRNTWLTSRIGHYRLDSCPTSPITSLFFQAILSKFSKGFCLSANDQGH